MQTRRIYYNGAEYHISRTGDWHAVTIVQGTHGTPPGSWQHIYGRIDRWGWPAR